MEPFNLVLMEIHCGVFLLIFSQSDSHSPITHMGQESEILLRKFVFPPLARALVFFLCPSHTESRSTLDPALSTLIRKCLYHCGAHALTV